MHMLHVHFSFSISLLPGIRIVMQFALSKDSEYIAHADLNRSLLKLTSWVGL
ncbi:hypothetical protein M758_1G029400 [Ceratodon purpureus]|uniref:Uncharacterized protein n=1 Tax=Ceratodon purpureus TaxID=3225 RepID=A0A8T0J2Y7_CERPU|nr:hypothetical protein KC19_1G031700 [Ceratodon purpureus]KAG0628469.1 hypothetical protein M758_1G029400 [Ceratodon purpureus]